MHKEGFTNDGSPEYTKHNPFVDNILIVEIKENMSWTMTARIEALIIFLVWMMRAVNLFLVWKKSWKQFVLSKKN